jgi:hypothetical protein
MKKYNELTEEERKKHNYPEPPEGNLRKPIEQFLSWYYENVDYPIASEAMVAYPERGYAGTLDAIAALKNPECSLPLCSELAIIDFKFASHLSPDYYLQCAGYAAAFEPYEIKFDKRIIIRLPKTLEVDVWDKKTHTYSKVENKLEVHEVKSNYEEDRDVFLHCLPLKAWINKNQDA